MSLDIKKFSDVLRMHKVSVTASRMKIFETLLQAERPLTNSEIVKRTPTVDRASVYRNLELFAELGITETMLRGWTPLTELAEPFRAHHHHMTCESCGRMIEIEDHELEEVLGSIVARHNFKLTKHLVELTGLCAQCQVS